MNVLRIFLGIFVAVIAASAYGAKPPLTEVVGDPIEAPGMTAVQITDRAIECMKSAASNVANLVEPLRDGDTVYAIIFTEYYTALGSASVARNRMSVFAKEGRFKIAHIDIEQGNPYAPNNWMPIYGHAGGGAKQAKAALEARSAAVAACIVKPATVPGGDNW